MISRRTVLTTAAGVAAAATVPVASASPVAAAPRSGMGPAARPTVPGVRARTARPVGGGVRVDRTQFPLSHLGISWQGTGRPEVRTRTADGWTGWRALDAGCGNRQDGTGTARRSVVLPVPGAIGYQVEIRGGSASLNVTELDTATRSEVSPLPGLRIGGFMAAVPFRSRARWGADESLRFGPDGSELFPPAYYPLQTLTVHHSATMNDDPDPAATVRAIYYYDTVTQGWGDLGYHFLIDEAGTVYEGRWSGTDPTFPTPGFSATLGADNRLPMVSGAHVTGFNSGNMGVVLLGDLTSRLPTAAARRSLTAVLAVLAGVGGLNPTGTTHFVNPVDGATADVATISGHRDWMATECPGNLFHPQLAQVRLDVAARMG